MRPGPRFGILGPVLVVDADGNPLDLGGRQARALLALLILARGRPVAPDLLIDAIWGGVPPASAAGTLQTYVSRLRRVLDGAAAAVRLDDGGYVLELGDAEVDATRFEDLAERGRALLATDPAAARAVLVEAEALWRGDALPEVRHHDVAIGPATRLDERRLTAVEDRLVADLALGRHELVVGELSALVEAHPLREDLQAKLALALYRAGRQAEALRAIARAGNALRDGLGIDPGRGLRNLELAILAQDPALDIVAAPLPTAPAAPTPAHAAASSAAPIVGRQNDLAELLATWDEAVAGTARFAVIEGEPGIGKTHLAESVRTAVVARGAVAVWGRCDEGGAAPALWPWLGPLRTLAQHHVVDRELARALAADEHDTAAPPTSAGRFALVDAVGELLDRAAEERPVLVLIDDLQWADDASLDLLTCLAAREGRRWMVMVTLRELEVGRNDQLVEALAAFARRAGTRRLRLRGLGRDDTMAMLAGVVDLDPTTTAAIHDRAEGNPFYAIELARLRDEGDRGVPAGVGDVIRRRIARLPAATADLLGVAAVAGREVDLPLLAQCAEVDLGAVLDHLDPAVAHRLLEVGPDRPTVLRFSHALVREVLLDGLTALRRARLHLRVADAMEASGEVGLDDVEILAEHLWQAAPAGAGRRAAEALERAADVALRRVSFSSAESHLRRALQLRRTGAPSEDDLRAQLRTTERLLGVIVATRYFQGVDDELLQLARSLADRLGEHDQLRQLLYYECSALLTSARRHLAAPVVAELVSLTRDDPRPTVRASGYEKEAVLLWSAGDITAAVALIDRAVALYREAPGPFDALVEEQRAVATMFSLMLHAMHGDVPTDSILEQFDAAVAEAADRAIASEICGFAATTASILGRWDDVARYVAMAGEDERNSQFAFWDGQLRMLHGVVLALDSDAHPDAEAAVRTFVEGRERYIGVRGRSSIATAEANLAIHLARRGHVTDAAAAAARARIELDEFDERWNGPMVLAAEAAVAEADGNGRAAELLARAVALATSHGSHALAARLAAQPGVAG